MLARKYNRRIEIYQAYPDTDGFGGNTVQESLMFYLWAEVSQNSAFRDNALGTYDIKNSYSFKIRSNERITPQLINDIFIKYKGMKYVISDIRYNDELFRETNIIANGISGINIDA